MWACFLQRSLSFLEKNVWPSRALLHTWAERKGSCPEQVNSGGHQLDKQMLDKQIQTSINLRNRYSSGLTYGTDEAGIVPGVAERLQELVSGLDRELAAMATGPKQTVEVLFLKETNTQTWVQVSNAIHACARWCHRCSTPSPLTLFAVWLSVLQVEGVVSDWLLAAGTQKTVDVPRLFQGIDHLLW